VTEEDYVPELF